MAASSPPPDRLAAQVELLCTRRDIGVASCLVEFGGDSRMARGYALHVEWMNTLREPEEIGLHRFVESPVARANAATSLAPCRAIVRCGSGAQVGSRDNVFLRSNAKA
jgi:hypothetical protein